MFLELSKRYLVSYFSGAEQMFQGDTRPFFVDVPTWDDCFIQEATLRDQQNPSVPKSTFGLDKLKLRKGLLRSAVWQ